MAIGAVKLGAQGLNAGAATTLNIPYPAGLAAADYALAISLQNTADESPAAPGGWTDWATLDTGSNTAPVLRIYGSPLVGTESGNLAIATASCTSWGRILAYPGVDPTNPIDVVWSAATMSLERTTALGTFPVPGFTVATAGATIVGAVAVNNALSAWTPPSGYTELVDANPTTPGGEIAHIQNVAAGATGTITFTNTGTAARGVAIVISLRPAPDLPIIVMPPRR